MQRVVSTGLLAMALAMGVLGGSARAEETKTLPTLLIKGEVVSLDNTDPSAILVKIKDRYGFETPIFITGQAKFFQGDTEVLKDALTTGAEVEVEYNFDINTAKRYAVMVKLPSASAAAAAASTPTTAAAESAPAPVAEAAPAAPAEAAPTAAQPTEGASTQ